MDNTPNDEPYAVAHPQKGVKLGPIVFAICASAVIGIAAIVAFMVYSSAN